MFYAHFVLSKKGPLARIWLAAHWDKKLTRAHVFETNISSSVEAILEPKLKMALRTSGHLLLGVVRIYSRKAKYLLADCNEAFVKIKMAFRPGVVDLPDEANREAAIAAITLPENIHDFEATIADLNEINMNTIAINQSRPEDITMREDFGEINLGRQDDDFGDSVFDEVSSREIIRDADKTFGDSIYRGSDHLSMHHDTDFTLNPDQDLDATLIDVKRGGGRLSDSEKPIKSIDSAAHHDDIGIGDNEFDDDFLAEPDDDDENFGGRIVHSLFTDGIFEDPSAQKQLENLTSEIESHMVTTRFDLNHESNTPIPTSGNDDLISTDGAAVVSKPVDAFPTTTASEITTTENALHVPPSTQPTETTTASRIGLGITTMTESTTLIGNESEAFALPPIDTTCTTGVEPRRATKRKRRLIVDEQKSIPSEVMKSQMENTADIMTQLDLAPPTKKLMYWKETGSVDKLFGLPGRAIPCQALKRLFSRNLYTVPDDPAGETFQASNILSGISFSSSQSLPDQSNVSLNPEVTALQPSTSFDPNMQQPNNVPVTESLEVTETFQVPQKLGAISEIPEDEASQLVTDEKRKGTPATPHGIEENQDDLDDEPNHDDLAFMVEPETPYLAPPSILSEAPPSVMQVDMLALERELAAADDEAENDLNNAFKDDDASGLLSGGFPGSEALSVEGLPSESIEERRLEKRSKVLLRMLRAHQQQYGWDEPLTLQGLCNGNTKKQAASKFYTVLLLRKQGAVELAQEAAYSDIHISRGPNFFRLVDN
uniref:Rad21_Rec8 domain-containing protein n=1 Tax=Trichobilharzia regenti TaxID=157069 RepID=A0AA85J5Z8_TRIRE|nr:unnamed protein product [Trichobilharzia regenti]